LEYPGTLYEYYDHLSRSENGPTVLSEPEAEMSKDKPQKSSRDTRKSRKMIRREKAERQSLITTTLKPIRDELSHLEDRISEFENREKELEKLVVDPEIIRDTSKYLPLLKEYGEVKEELEASMLRWDRKQEQLISIKRELEI
jgi:hypothetical protein